MMYARILLWSCCCCALAAADGALLQGGGFDREYATVAVPDGSVARISGSLAAPWRDNSDWADLTVAYAQDRDRKRSGTSAQRMRVDAIASGSPQLVQGLTPAAGAGYRATVWVRADAPVPVNLLVQRAAEPYTRYGRAQVLAGDEWRELRLEWTAPDAEPVLIVLNPERAGTVWFDDAGLERVQAAAEQRAAAAPAHGPQQVLADAFDGAARPVAQRPGPATVAGTLAAPWRDDSAWAPVDLRYAVDPAEGHTAPPAQRIQVRAIRGGRAQLVTDLPLRAGHRYRAGLWARAASVMPVQLQIRLGPPPYTTYATTVAALSPVWQRIELQWTQREDAAGLVMLMPQTPGTLWIDDLVVVDRTHGDVAAAGADPRPGNLVAHGSFEAGLGNEWHLAWGDRRTAPGTWRTASGGTHGERCLSLDLAGRTVRVHTAPVTARAGQSMTLAVDLRASAPLPVELKLTEAHSTLVTVGPQWQRYHLGGAVAGTVHGWISVIDPGHDAVLEIDAVTVVDGGEPAAYRSRHPHAVTLACPHPGHVVPAHGAVAFDATVVPAAPEGARWQLAVHDAWDRTRRWSASAGARIVVPPGERALGTWLLEAQLVDAAGAAIAAPARIAFSRLPPAHDPAAASFFGIHLPFTPYGYALARACGQPWLRVHDAGVFTKWAAVEPERDAVAFDDAAIDAARAAGLHVLGTLDGAPGWATTGPVRTQAYFKHWHLPDVADGDERWRRYVARTVAHYAGRIDHWEVWNEAWSADHFFPGGTPEDYARLLTIAAAAARDAHPAVTLLGVNTAANQDPFTTAVLAAAGTDDYDLFSWHEYNTAPGGWPATIVAHFRDMQAAYGQAKGQVVTEGGNSGQLVGLAGGTLPALALHSAAWIVRVDAELLAAGVLRHFWYTAHFTAPAGIGSFSAIEHDGAIKPALAARAVLAWFVEGAICTGLATDADSGLTTVGFRHADGRTVEVLWSGYGDEIALPAAPGTQCFDLFGNPVDAAAVGSVPLYRSREEAQR